MRSPAARIILKIFVLLGCIACVITKALTDTESRRVFLRNQKYSREWGLLHNLFWSSSGNAFANVTYGGFTLITALMLISRFIDAKSRPSLVEKIFLTVGMLCFFAMGGVVFAAYDQVPHELHDNAIILGCLSFFVGFLLLFDLADPMARHTSDTTQTENIGPSVIESQVKPKVESKEIITDPPKSNVTNIQIHKDSTQDVEQITRNGNYHRNNDEIDFVQTKSYPSAQQPVFEKVLLPEKSRSSWRNIPDPRANTSQMDYIIPDHEPPNYEYRRADRYYQNHAYDYDYNSPPESPRSGRSRYSNGTRMMVVRDYSRAATSTGGSTRSQPEGRYRDRQRQNYRQRSYRNDDEEDSISPVRPGFVANAAKMWDSRARRSSDLLNTDV